MEIVKKKRKLTTKEKFESFDLYLDALTTSHQVKYLKESKPLSHSVANPSQKDDSLLPFHDALRKCHDKHKSLGPLLEGLTGLQLAMQGVLEAIIYLDRLVYALEAKFCSTAELVNIFDAKISPRCFALVLYK